MGYLNREPRTTLFIVSLLFLGNHQWILTNSAQEVVDASYYYNSCAPSSCNGLTLTDPLAASPFCHPPELEISCLQTNKTNTTTTQRQQQILLFTVVNTRTAFRVLPTRNFTANLSDGAVAKVSIIWADDRLFSCGPISQSNPRDPSPTKDLSLPSDFVVGTHLNCTVPLPLPLPVQRVACLACLGCPGQDSNNSCYYKQGFVSHSHCETFHMFTPSSFNVSAEKDLRAYLQLGHEFFYTKPPQCPGCRLTGGRCGFSPSSASFVCFCPFTVHRLNCSDEMIVDITTWGSEGRSSGQPTKALIISVVSALASVVLLALVALLIVQWKHRVKEEVALNMSPSRYSYSQIKRFTNNFSSKLGEGAYGNVYKGVIHRNGIDVAVAVKLLKFKESEKQFINEVATTGAIRHQHLVSLLGYCAQGKTRALVYEFMEKGSLDKYIYDTTRKGGHEEEKTNFERISYDQRFTIALQTARGILYLHQGCRPSILHFDIKPHNVLLDSSFTAKVADFGLARMMGIDHSHVSLTRARGTPGYVAPEVWLKTCGPVTKKSDVYSYGMMLLEMVGRRKNCDQEANESSNFYFPIWAYNKIKIGELPLLQMSGLMGDDDDHAERRDEEEELIERMCLVGLWCIQPIPSNRPSMDEVIQMLEGNVELGIPPHPFPHLIAENVEPCSYKSNPTVGSVSMSLEAR